jgi:hypothetical protein
VEDGIATLAGEQLVEAAVASRKTLLPLHRFGSLSNQPRLINDCAGFPEDPDSARPAFFAVTPD